MKTKTLNRILLLSLFALSSFYSFAQGNFWIEGPQEVCMGDCHIYTINDSTANQGIDFVWTLSNGQTLQSNGPWVEICWDFPGTYELWVTWTSLDGESYTAVTTVYVSEGYYFEIFSTAPSVCAANDSIPGGGPSFCEKVCAGSVVTYFLTDPNLPVFWYVTGGEIVDQNSFSVEVEWGSPGSGQVYAELFDDFCFGTNSVCVEILEDPVASFNTVPPSQGGVLSICEGQTVFFENTSLNAETYEWSLGLETTDEVSPSYTYENPGTFQVTLVAFNECFCTDTTTLMIEVQDAISPFVDCVSTICEGETVTYTSDADCGTFNWVVSGNGTIVDGGGAGDDFVTIDWGAGPEGIIELTVDNCSNADYCLEPNVIQVPIISDLAEIEGPEKVCGGDNVEYSIIPYEGTEFMWSISSFGTIVDGHGNSSISVEWFDGVFPNQQQWIAVQYDNCYLGCGGSDTIFVDIKPEFYLSGAIEVCENATTEYFSISTQTNLGIPANWEVNDASGSTVWNSAAPTSNPSIDWDFGPGIYTLSAVPDNLADFCLEESELPITIQEAPPAVDAIVGETVICPGETYSYEANSSQPENNFRWEINDGGIISERSGNPINVTWGATPPYELSVIQISTSGLPCESDPISITADAVGTFTITGNDQACQDQVSIYTADPYDGVDYVWTIIPDGAGSIVNDPNSHEVEVLWHIPGAATLNLDICSQSASFNVNVNPRPQPVVNHPAELCPNEIAEVQTTLSFTNYTWKDDNGAVVSTLPNPSLGPGYYQVVVEDDLGCIGDTTFYIDGHPQSEISISTPGSTGFCAGAPPIDLYALDTDGGYSYQWYHDGNPVGTDSPIYSTNEFGNYHVEILDQYGCTYSSNTLNLFEFCGSLGGGVCTGGTCVLLDCDPGTNVVIDIINTAECNTSNFTSTLADVIPGTLQWEFDDPDSGADNFSNLDNPTHVYTKAGFYTVVATALVDDNGSNIICWDAKIDTVEVAANFDVDNACPGEVVYFFDISTFLPLPTTGIASWSWDFGDPASGADNTSTDQHPTHIFASEGSYDVTLVITSNSGCTSTKTKTLNIYPYPPVSFEEPVVVCEATASPFVADVDASVTYVVWDFGDPASGDANSSELFETFHVYDNPGNYMVTLTVQSIYGCTNSFSRTITIEPNGLAGDISFSSPSPICEGDSTTLTASPGGISWLWSTGDTTESITVGTADVYTVTVTDDEGCQYSPDAAVVDVWPAPESPIRAVELNDFMQAVAYFYDGYETCEGEDIYLETFNNSQYSFTWSNTDEGPETEYSESRGNLLPPGNHDVTLSVTDNTTGCTNEIGPFSLVVHPLPVNVQIQSSPMGLICESTETTFDVVSPDANLTYVWSNGEIGESITTDLAGEYYVTAITQFGCSRESNRITIEEGPDISKIPSGCHVRCSPDTICLPTIPGIVSYQWFFNGNPIAGPDGTIPELIVTESGDYYLEMVDNKGCSLSSEVLSLDIFIGFGTIDGNVYYDVNDNGIIDGPDTLMNGIDIKLLDGATELDEATSDQNGQYAFPNIQAIPYTLEIDTTSFPDEVGYTVLQVDTVLSGCDNTIQIDWLLIQDCPENTATESLTACQGSQVIYDGVALNPGDQQDFFFTTASGCDSVVTVTVTELPTDASNLQLETCPGTMVDYEGTMLSPGDQQDFTLTNQYGCDSVVTVSVMASPTDATTLQLEACPGATVDYEGMTLNVGDQEDFTLTNQYGCDSVVTVSVMASPTDATALQLEACPGSTVDYEGVTLNIGDQQDFTLTNQYGCDSIITVTVSALPTDVELTQLQTCAGESIEYNGMMLNAGEQIDFTLTNQYGCDSIVTVSVQAYPEFSYTLESSASCPDDFDTGMITVENITGGQPPFMFSLDGTTFQDTPEFNALSPDIYSVHVRDVNGCIGIQAVEVEALAPLVIGVKDHLLPCDELETTLKVSILSGDPANLTYMWSDGSTDPTITVSEPGEYSVQIFGDCEFIKETINVAYEDQGRSEYLYIPNAFSPNGDGINDFFQPFPGKEVQIEGYEVHVFDRWGNQVYQSDAMDNGWDGVYKGKKMQTGVFVWHLKAQVYSCGRMIEVEKQGDLVLLR